jgi:stage V sporulation protein B
VSAAAQPSEFSTKTFKTFLLRVLTQILSVGSGIIIARALGPAGKGLFTYAGVVLSLLVTLGGGASIAVSRQYGRMKRPSGLVYAAMMRFYVVICLPIALALAGAAIVMHQPVLLAPAIAFPFAYLNQVSVGFSLAEGDVRFANRQALVSAVALVVVAALVCYGLRLGVAPMLVGWVGVNVAISVYSMFKISKYAHGGNTREELALAFRDQCFFGFRVTINQLLTLLNYQVDIFIVLFILGHAALGRYSIAVGIGMMMWQLSRPLSVTSYGSVTRGTPQQAARVTVVCVRHALFSVGVACIILAFLGPWLLQAVYGPAFAASGRALQLLLPGIVAYCTVPFFSQYFTLQLGKPTLNTIVIASSTILCAIVTLLLIRQYGIAAGAIGTSVSYTAAFALCTVIFSRYTRISPSALFAFTTSDLAQYGLLARWILNGMRSVSPKYVRRGS